MEPNVVYPGFQKPKIRLKLFRAAEGIPAMKPLVGLLAVVVKGHDSFNTLLAKTARVTDRHCNFGKASFCHGNGPMASEVLSLRYPAIVENGSDPLSLVEKGGWTRLSDVAEPAGESAKESTAS